MAFDLSFIHAFDFHRKKTDSAAPSSDEIYQVSTISALIDGIYDGEMTFKELARHGGWGLGTLNALDGEMIAVDGKFYQINSGGKVRHIAPEEKTPFAAVINFHPHHTIPIAAPIAWEEFQKRTDQAVVSTNLFYAFRATGKFSWLKARSVPRQNKPYPGLAEVAKVQTIFELKDVSGILVGFRFPNYTQTLNVTGYHVHFISDDRNAGGHVLDFRMESGTIEIDPVSGFRMELPHGGDFLKADFSADPSAAVHSAENDSGQS